MKHYFVLLCFLLLCEMGIKAQRQPSVIKTFTYDERVHDFGTIYEKKGPVSHAFTFTNEGNLPVVISDVTGWCGCTSYEYPKQPIFPGKKAKVKITYNPYGRPGKFSKELAVVLNNGKYFTRIWVKGNVIGYQHPVKEDYPYDFGQGLFLGFNVFKFGNLNPGEQYTFEQRIANNTNKPMTVEFEKVPNNRVLKMPAKIVLKAKERKTFKVSYRQVKQYPYDRYITVKIKVNGKAVKPMKVIWFGNSHQ